MPNGSHGEYDIKRHRTLVETANHYTKILADLQRDKDQLEDDLAAAEVTIDKMMATIEILKGE